MDRHRVLRSAALSVAQVVVAGVALLFFYRYLIDTIGVTAVGVWSVVLATTSIARIADFGLGTGLSRFVARAGAQKNILQAARYVETAVVSSAGVAGLLAALSLPALKPLLANIVAHESLGIALAMLPYALLSYWSASVTSVFQGGLDGVLRVDLRNLIMIASSLLQVALGVALVHWTGVMGLAYAQLSHALIILTLSWAVLHRALPALSLVPRKWDYVTFRELVHFGWKLHVASIAVLLFEPVTKGLLARFGGLASAGYYEMATRMIQQLRALLVNANEVLAPAVADAQESAPGQTRLLYRRSYRVVSFLVLPVMGVILVSLPAISVLWIGQSEPRFVTFAALLTVGWFLNALTAPSYFTAIGAGRLRWILLGHIMLAVLNVAAGYGFGMLYGGTGVVVAAMLSLVVGSAVIIVNNHRDEGEPWGSLAPPGTALLFVASLVGIGTGLLTYQVLQPRHGVALGLLVSLSIWFACIAWPAWQHPVRRQFLGSLISLFPTSTLATSQLSLRQRVVAWMLGNR